MRSAAARHPLESLDDDGENQAEQIKPALRQFPMVVRNATAEDLDELLRRTEEGVKISTEVARYETGHRWTSATRPSGQTILSALHGSGVRRL
jgi:hypothetical protein